MKVRFIVLLVGCVLGPGAALASAHVSVRAPVIHAIDHLRGKTNELRAKAGLKPPPTTFTYRKVDDPQYRDWVRAVWQSRLETARARVLVPPVWRSLARCETGGNWRHVNATYQGGLGFYHGSWDAYRPAGFPREAHEATPAQQVAVGERIRRDVGWGAWPACSRRLGLR